MKNGTKPDLLKRVRSLRDKYSVPEGWPFPVRRLHGPDDNPRPPTGATVADDDSVATDHEDISGHSKNGSD